MPSDTYYELHAVCPRCGSDSIEHTLRGCGPPDTNRAICRARGCDWAGIVDQLAPCRPPMVEDHHETIARWRREGRPEGLIQQSAAQTLTDLEAARSLPPRPAKV